MHFLVSAKKNFPQKNFLYFFLKKPLLKKFIIFSHKKPLIFRKRNFLMFSYKTFFLQCQTPAMESFAKNSYLAQLLASTFKSFLYFGKRNFLIFPEIQTFAKYLRLTLVFWWNSAQWERFNFYFSRFFGSFKKIFILNGRLGTRLSFYEVLLFSCRFLIS